MFYFDVDKNIVTVNVNVYGEDTEVVSPDENVAFSYSCPDNACAILLFDRFSEFYATFLSNLEEEAFERGVASVKNAKVRGKQK